MTDYIPGAIVPGSRLTIEVTGETEPLLGDEYFTRLRLTEDLESRLQRRGFSIDDQEWDYQMAVEYLVQSQKGSGVSGISPPHSRTVQLLTSLGSLSGTLGLGVSVASAVGKLARSPQNKTEQISESQNIYTHTLSLELFDPEARLLWIGAATWSVPNLDQGRAYFFVLQLLLSTLPFDPDIRPQLPELKPSHAKNYYRLTCNDLMFSCPALPFHIKFIKVDTDQFDQPRRDGKLSSIIRNPEALAAYVDLINRAEFALPVGGVDYSDPLNRELWEAVRLGGRYLLGPTRSPVNVLIDLQGAASGYVITECRVVDDNEYATFQSSLNLWKDALELYYDMFVR